MLKKITAIAMLIASVNAFSGQEEVQEFVKKNNIENKIELNEENNWWAASAVVTIGLVAGAVSFTPTFTTIDATPTTPVPALIDSHATQIESDSILD